MGAQPLGRGTDDPSVMGNYANISVLAKPDENTITITRELDKGTGHNGVDVQTVDSTAVTGTTKVPGYIYTGNFSGCVFYLYKTGLDEMTGVHAYSGYVSETTRKGFFRRKVINNVVREFSPQSYFARSGGRLIDRYETRGEIDPTTGENGLSFLSCVERTTITTFLFSLQSSAEGSRVKRVLRVINLGY
ncbi:hypothetical protein [Roseomonas sp. HF4]|uniref:hypothetical protein n=1 Tax=Roseomonas sp. HF4 TaxID=2562313 RepID=UPI0010BF6A42|nr:hypothetical protein [Roseomonas sp. HF4]